MKRLNLDRKEQSMENVQRTFDRLHREFFKMWVALYYN